MSPVIEKLKNDVWLLVITAGIGLLIFIGIILGILFWQYGRDKKERDTPSNNPPTEEKSIETNRETNTNTGGETKIISDDEFAGREIEYTNSGFTPQTIRLNAQDAKAANCLIRVANKSTGELLVRLGPPQEEDNRGFLYSPVKPGETQIFDPRYTGILEAEFYNRNKPEHQIRLILLPACTE